MICAAVPHNLQKKTELNISLTNLCQNTAELRMAKEILLGVSYLIGIFFWIDITETKDLFQPLYLYLGITGKLV